MRALRDAERFTVKILAAALQSEQERVQLLEDLAHCTVEDKISDGSLLVFHIEGYSRPHVRRQEAFRGKDGFPLEGSIKDADGTEMSVYLFSDSCKRILELELDKHALVPVIRPDWQSFRMR